MIEFRTLGTLDLRDANGRELHSLLVQPKRIALLAYLCIAEPIGFHRRDTLLGVFWPEADEEHARASLRRALHILRRVLGDGVIVSRGDEEVAVDTSVVACDALRFQESVRASRFEQALELYKGDLLTGFFIEDVPDFEHWLHATRAKLRESAARAAYAAAASLQSKGDLAAALAFARRSLELADTDERTLRRLIELQASAGDRAGAMEAYESFARRLESDYETQPSPETKNLIARVRSRESADNLSIAKPIANKDARSVASVPVSADVPGPPLKRSKSVRSLVFGALSVATIAIVGMLIASTRRPAGSTSSTRIAILPFSVTGSGQSEGIGPGMVELLGAALDGAGPLTTVDERAVFSTVKREAADSSDPNSAARVARLLGAGKFVLGNAAFVANRVLVNAAIYRSDGSTDPLVRVHEDGSSDSLIALVNRIARQIVAGSYPGAKADLAELAMITTPSNDALKSYLRGRLSFREGRHQAALADFERAVAIDSTFALGWYALGRTASFTPQRDLERRALLRANELRGRLPPIDQLRVVSEFLYASGNVEESEKAFREILRRRPDDVDAQFGLTVLLAHSAHRLGRSAAEAEPLLKRLRYYEPDNLDALNFERAVAADSHDLKRYDAASRRYVELSPNADFALPYRVEQAFLQEDSAAADSEVKHLATADDFLVGFAAISVGGYLHNLSGALSITQQFVDPRRPRDVQVSGRVMLSELELAQGHWRNASQQLDEAARLDSSTAITHRALLSLHPFLRLPPDSLRMLYGKLESSKAPLASNVDWFVRDGLQRSFAPQFRLYLLGALANRLGERSVALSAADKLDRSGPDEIGRQYSQAAAVSLRAQVALADGQFERAAQLFDSSQVHVWWSMYYLESFFSQPLERYLHAQALERLGRLEDAARWYRTSTGAMSVGETPYLVPSLIGLRNIEAKLNRAEEVSRIDTRIREVWRDPDPQFMAFQPRR